PSYPRLSPYTTLSRSEPAPIGAQALDQGGGSAHQREVLLDCRTHFGPQHLDRHLATIMQHGKVHLCHRGRSHGHTLEMRKEPVRDRKSTRLNSSHVKI